MRCAPLISLLASHGLTAGAVSWLVSITNTTPKRVIKVSLLGLARPSDNLTARATDLVLIPATASQARLSRCRDVQRVAGSISLIAAALLLEVIGHVAGSVYVVLTLDELHGKTAINVPHNMAMHEPGTWIVSFETHHSPAIALKHSSITTRWVVEIERSSIGSGERALALAEKGEVVAVKMDGMTREELVLDDEVNPLVRTVVEIYSVANKARIAVRGKSLEGWLGVVDVHATSVEEPSKDSAIIGSCEESNIASWHS